MKKVWIVSWNKYLKENDARISCVFSVHRTKYGAISEMKKWKCKDDKFFLESYIVFDNKRGELHKTCPACRVHFDTGDGYGELGEEWLTCEGNMIY